jgi:hypothetical protein
VLIVPQKENIMSLSEAMRIVQKMSAWSMMAQGVPVGKEPEPITEDLQTLLSANRKVKKAKEKIVKEIRKNPSPPLTRKKQPIQLTLPDRTIAALFVAANFPGNNTENIDVLSMHGDNIVLCIDKKTL